MSDPLSARLLSGLGFGGLGLIGMFGSGWTAAGGMERVAFVAALTAAVVGIVLEVRHRRRRVTGDEPA